MSRLVVKAGSRPPWVGLAASLWVEFAAANAYTFPLYSDALKRVLGYSQQQITLLGVALDIGENVGILPGIACNKFPPWCVLLLGALHCILGYGVVWLAISKTLPYLPFWVMFLAIFVGTNSNSWFGTSVLVTNMRNFPLSRGTVAGMLKGFIGISAAVYSMIFSTVLDSSPFDLLLFLTFGIPALCVVMMYFVQPCTPSTEEDSSAKRYFLFIQGASVVLAISLVAFKVISRMITLSDAVNYTCLVLMVLLMTSPLAIPVKMTLDQKKQMGNDELPISSEHMIPREDESSNRSEHMIPREGESSNRDTLLISGSEDEKSEASDESDYLSDIEILLAEGSGAVRRSQRPPKRGEDFKFREAFVKVDFWLLWLVYFLGAGSGVTVLNNLAQIGATSGLNDTTILLTIFSFCNFTGRLGGGVISEHFVKSNALPRTVWMTLSHIFMILAFLLYSSAIAGSLYVATAFVGICYGAQFSSMIPTASELFGLKNFGIIFNFMQIGNPLGAFLFSSLLAGYLYDKEAEKQGGSTCLGPNCYRSTYFTLAGLCALGTFLSIILSMRIRPVYHKLYPVKQKRKSRH